VLQSVTVCCSVLQRDSEPRMWCVCCGGVHEKRNQSQRLLCVVRLAASGYIFLLRTQINLLLNSLLLQFAHTICTKVHVAICTRVHIDISLGWQQVLIFFSCNKEPSRGEVIFVPYNMPLVHLTGDYLRGEIICVP